MAKNLTGERAVVSANRLIDGVVVFLDAAGQWTDRLSAAAVARDGEAAERLLQLGRVVGAEVIDPFLVAVTEEADGVLEPVSLREKIRASGLTFDAIAAEAVRYA